MTDQHYDLIVIGADRRGRRALSTRRNWENGSPWLSATGCQMAIPSTVALRRGWRHRISAFSSDLYAARTVGDSSQVWSPLWARSHSIAIRNLSVLEDHR